jgi:hypothetical protein
VRVDNYAKLPGRRHHVRDAIAAVVSGPSLLASPRRNLNTGTHQIAVGGGGLFPTASD